MKRTAARVVDFIVKLVLAGIVNILTLLLVMLILPDTFGVLAWVGVDVFIQVLITIFAFYLYNNIFAKTLGEKLFGLEHEAVEYE